MKTLIEKMKTLRIYVVIQVRWILSVWSFYFKNLFLKRGQTTLFKYDIFRHNEIQDGIFGYKIKKEEIISDEVNSMIVLKKYVKDVFIKHDVDFNKRIGQKWSDMDNYELGVRLAQTRFDEKDSSAKFKYTTWYILPHRPQIKIGQTAEYAQDAVFVGGINS